VRVFSVYHVMNDLVFSFLTACHNIDQWPAPTPGETLNLPLLGSVLQVSDCLGITGN
jgi:hypothetical protein